MLHPGAYREEDRALTIHVVRAVLRIVFYHEDDRVFPAWAVRDEIHCQAQRRVVVLDKSHIRPGRAVGVNVERPTTVVVRVVKIDIRRKLTHVLRAIDVMRLEDLFETAEPAEAG